MQQFWAFRSKSEYLNSATRQSNSLKDWLDVLRWVFCFIFAKLLILGEWQHCITQVKASFGINLTPWANPTPWATLTPEEIAYPHCDIIQGERQHYATASFGISSTLQADLTPWATLIPEELQINIARSSLVWPQNLIAIIDQIMATPSQAPSKPLFEFNLSSEAAHKNYLLLKHNKEDTPSSPASTQSQRPALSDQQMECNHSPHQRLCARIFRFHNFISTFLFSWWLSPSNESLLRQHYCHYNWQRRWTMGEHWTWHDHQAQLCHDKGRLHHLCNCCAGCPPGQNAWRSAQQRLICQPSTMWLCHAHQPNCSLFSEWNQQQTWVGANPSPFLTLNA